MCIIITFYLFIKFRIRRIFGDICELSLQALDSTQSTIFACLQASSSQLSLEYYADWGLMYKNITITCLKAEFANHPRIFGLEY